VKQPKYYSRYLDYRTSLEALFGENRYVSNYEFEELKKEYQNVTWSLAIKLSLIAENFFSFRFIRAFKIIQSSMTTDRLLLRRNLHNQAFIAQEIQKSYVTEGKDLDPQQIEAVVACEDANLVIAAAGSGKTLSLIAKIQYIHEQLNIPLSKILTISYTNNTAQEIKERLEKLGLATENVRTFHSLGNSILDEASPEKKSLIQKNAIDKFISETIKSLRENDTDFSRNCNDYLLFFHTMPIDPSEITTAKELVSFNKSFLQESLQSVSLRYKDYDKTQPTSAREFVRSKEEQIIANFLFINQIPYKYEKQYAYISNKYTPDFTIEKFGEPIYLEHWGISKDGKVSPTNGNPMKYKSKMNWARNLHRQNGTILIESSSYMCGEGSLLTHIESELKREGAELVRRQESEIAELINKAYKYDAPAFAKLCVAFLELYKNSSLTLEGLEAKINNLSGIHRRTRAQKFYELFKQVYLAYEQHLEENILRDFADMIKLATTELVGLADSSLEFDYILVDEVQDLSYGRFALLKALLHKNPGARLFCVGDDWQSIYRFAGSDLTLLEDFESIFERETYKSVIEKTHRFGDPTVSISSNFIQKNTKQYRKNVTFSPDKQTPIEIHLNALPNEDATTLHSLLLELLSKHGADGLHSKSIQVLSRYNWDVNRLRDKAAFEVGEAKDSQDVTIKWRPDPTAEPFQLAFCTMHRAKGLTRDIIVVLNCNDGSLGMPSTRRDDPILNLLLAHPDGYLYSEERRLFYVAITRATDETHLIANSKNASPFLFEIDKNLSSDSRTGCPACEIGELVTRKSPTGDFTACNNFRYGCRYQP